jgi:hypothetical protein
MLRRPFKAYFILVACLFCSCSSKPDYGKETFPVTGTVFVDGEAAAELGVTLHNVKGMATDVPTFSATTTKADGTFSVSTFEEGDGVPAGEYVVTFVWGKLSMISMSYEGDRLKGKYNDPSKSEFKLTVIEGQPTDMGRIDLTTK